MRELESVGIRLNKRRPNIYFNVLLTLIVDSVFDFLERIRINYCFFKNSFPNTSVIQLNVKPKKTGGVKVTTMVNLTHVDEKLVQLICHDYSVFIVLLFYCFFIYKHIYY